LRYSVYLAGCAHHCPGCHNPESWNPAAGTPLTEERVAAIIREINANPLLDGVTFSGGDPLYHPEEFRALSRRVREETHLNIWCYTGYTLEQIQRDARLSAAVEYVDVLVEGPYVEALRDPYLAFRGSSNQRLVKLHAEG
jgi:anaerobic ribonucleoside-triphosphate reductase activating protein